MRHSANTAVSVGVAHLPRDFFIDLRTPSMDNSIRLQSYDNGCSGMSGAILRAINQTRGTVLCARIEDAGGVAGQSRGLLGRDSLAPDHGMLFVRSRFEPFMWMHMFFMRFPIDIVFLDRDDRVVWINHRLKPWRMSAIVMRARKAIELAAGCALLTGTTLGDLIRFEPN